MRETGVPVARGVRALCRTRGSIARARRLLAAALGVLVAACATPAQHFAREAQALGFASEVVAGDPFRHVVYYAGVDTSADVLHVYIEHDGTPWIDGRIVSDDPTPRTPFALELMARDSGPRLFLGRPCYFATRRDRGCSTLMWTNRRYAPEVVDSMAAALRAFLARHSYRDVVLIGYSGGGTLAWLLASRVPQASAVVTIGANLDTAAWTELHAYDPLAGSLDPAAQPPLPASIVHVAYVGERDENVPPSIVRSFAARHPQTRIVEVAGFDHRCCWIERWPQLLRDAMMSR
jgi:dienelactone hydrolase